MNIAQEQPRWFIHAHKQGAFMDSFRSSADRLFVLLGAIMILAMHAGFAFLELGTVRNEKSGKR